MKLDFDSIYDDVMQCLLFVRLSIVVTALKYNRRAFSYRTYSASAYSSISLADNTDSNVNTLRNMTDSIMENCRTINSSEMYDSRVVHSFFHKIPVTRQVFCQDAVLWLKDPAITERYFTEGTSVFTSLPDISEVSALFHGPDIRQRTEAYKKWFFDIVENICQSLAPGSFAIFLQSDVRVLTPEGQVLQWIDKGHICSSAAEKAGCCVMWHKLTSNVHNRDKRTSQRPSYSHLLCVGRY